MQAKDTTVLQLELQNDSLKRATKILSRVSILSLVLVSIMLIALIFFVRKSYTSDQSLRVHYEEKLKSERTDLINGLYSVQQAITDGVSTRKDRLAAYTIIGKKIILQRNAKTDLTDAEINKLLVTNFNLAEQYLMNPMLFLAYAAVESDFTKKAKSSAGAVGIVQFMPYTLKLVLQDQYSPGVQYNPIMQCKAWYRYITVLSESVGGDLLWTACAYMSPLAIKFYNQKKTVEQFMQLMSQTTDNTAKYPFLIKNTFLSYQVQK